MRSYRDSIPLPRVTNMGLLCSLRGILVVRFLFDLRQVQPVACETTSGLTYSASLIFGNLGSQIAGLGELDESSNEEIQIVSRSPENRMV